MKVRDVIRLLREDGWEEVRTKGSHRVLRHPLKPGIVVISGHAGSDIPKGLLRAILKQAGLEGAR